MIKIKNNSDNYTDFSMLEPGDVFYWEKYSGYFMKINKVLEPMVWVTNNESTSSRTLMYNAVGLDDPQLYLVSEDAEVVKATSAILTVEM